MKHLSKSTLSQWAWAGLPEYVKHHVFAYLGTSRPGVLPNIQYHWDQHLSEQGRYCVLKAAGLE